jgi:ABC-type Zn uptake system ZnuABC Zn-binding protein ZnuA
VKVLEAAAGLELAAENGLPPNPHVWLDPLLACRLVTNILTALQALDPRERDLFAANAAGLVARLEALHRELQATLEPCRGAGIVTHHDAFAHFARRYDLRVVGVIEEVPDIDPSPRHLSKLRQVIASEHVRAIFIEPQHPSRLARQLGRDLGLAVVPLDTLESGPARPEAYEEGMRSNARVLRRYLP